MWAGHSIAHKDGFFHLPTVEEWIRSATTLKGVTERALLWSKAEAAMSLERQYGRDADGPPRVGYNIQADEPFFVVSGYDGRVHIACDCEQPMTLD